MLLNSGVGGDFWESIGTARRSNQSILKEISPEYSLDGLILKLKLQYFGHLMRRTDSFEKTLMLGKIEERSKSRWQRMRWLDGITNSMHMCCSTWSHKELDTTEQMIWTEPNSEYKLNKQYDSIQPWCTPFPIWNQSIVPCLVLIVAWPACRFLKRQVRWSGIPISFRIFHSLSLSTQSKALV